MKKTSNEWQKYFPAEKVGAQFFDEFATRAQNVAAKVFRVKTAREAQALILQIIKDNQAKKVVATKDLLNATGALADDFKTMGIEFYSEQSDIRQHADTCDVGIAKVEFAIAETGSVCEDSLAIEQRLATTLPPVSIVVMQSKNVVPDVETAFEIISQVFSRGYISFITGPSRTSDIERVLTIGVHGPSQFNVIAIDDEEAKGA